MKKKVKIILAAALALIAAGGVAAATLTPLVLDAVTLEASSAKVTFTEQGSYVYTRSMTVYPQIAGEVLEIKVNPGDAVKQGDVLAVVSASDYEYQIKGLESAIAGYEAQINNLGAQNTENRNTLYSTRESLVGQISQIDASLKELNKNEKIMQRQIDIQEDIMAQNQNLVNLLREDYSEARRDYDDGIIDQAQFNAIRQAYTQAQTARDASRQQYEELRNGVAGRESLEAQRESALAQINLVDSRLNQNSTWAMRQYYGTLIDSAKQNIENMSEKLGQATILATISGVIEELPARDTNVITQAGAVATIGAEPAVEVYVPIREVDGVHVGDKVELAIDKRLGDESVSGTVSLIEDEAEIKVSALGVEERKVRVLIDPDGDSLHVGYSVDVKFTVFEQENTVVVPKTAVFEKSGQDMVWVIENGVAALKPIEKGVETREGYAVNSGLNPGDVVISDANDTGLKEGKKVKPTA